MRFFKNLLGIDRQQKVYNQPLSKTCPSCWDRKQYQQFSLNQDTHLFSSAFAKAFRVEYVDCFKSQKGIYYCHCCKQKYKHIE